jgi:hypothetical protein
LDKRVFELNRPTLLLEAANGEPLGRAGPLKLADDRLQDFPAILIQAVLSTEVGAPVIAIFEFHQLLCDGAAALYDSSGDSVGMRSPENSQRVEGRSWGVPAPAYGSGRRRQLPLRPLDVRWFASAAQDR